MRRSGIQLISIMACLAIQAAPALSWSAPESPAQLIKVDQQVYVTNDSKPGWTPSQDQIQAVQKVVRDYLAAQDHDRYAGAFNLMTPSYRNARPLSQLSDEVREFNVLAGRVQQRQILRVTWTKDPADPPTPGVYAFVDLKSRFADVDRHCGSIVLYQEPSGGDFLVLHERSYFIDNSDASEIAHKLSDGGLKAAWAKVSSACQNLPG